MDQIESYTLQIADVTNPQQLAQAIASQVPRGPNVVRAMQIITSPQLTLDAKAQELFTDQINSQVNVPQNLEEFFNVLNRVTQRNNPNGQPMQLRQTVAVPIPQQASYRTIQQAPALRPNIANIMNNNGTATASEQNIIDAFRVVGGKLPAELKEKLRTNIAKKRTRVPAYSEAGGFLNSLSNLVKNKELLKSLQETTFSATLQGLLDQATKIRKSGGKTTYQIFKIKKAKGVNVVDPPERRIANQIISMIRNTNRAQNFQPLKYSDSYIQARKAYNAAASVGSGTAIYNKIKSRLSKYNLYQGKELEDAITAKIQAGQSKSLAQIQSKVTQSSNNINALTAETANNFETVKKNVAASLGQGSVQIDIPLYNRLV